MESLAAFLVLLSLVAVGWLSDRFQRPKLEQVHLAIIACWLVGWGLVILYWWSLNDSGGGWFGPGVVAFFGLVFFLGGIGVISVIALIARAVSAETRTRSAVLIGVPLLVVVWLYFAFLHPQLTESRVSPTGVSTHTGLVTEYIPKDWVFHATTGGPGYDADIYVDHTDLNRPANEDSQLIIGIRREAHAYPPGRTATLSHREFLVIEDGDHILVVDDLGIFKIEVSSNTLPVETLLQIAWGTNWDPSPDEGA